jgi:hypothetical protein
MSTEECAPKAPPNFDLRRLFSTQRGAGWKFETPWFLFVFIWKRPEGRVQDRRLRREFDL